MTDLPVRTWNDLVVPTAGTYVLDTAHKRLGFQATHMMVSAVRGEFEEGTATIEIAEDPLATTVVAQIRADSLSTLNPERDAHLRSPDFLDVENHPTIDFRSTGLTWETNQPDPIFTWARLKGRTATVPEQATRPSTRFQLHGELTIRGVTRPLTLHAEFGGARRDPYGQDIVGFSATAQFDREDFGLVWNVMLEAGGVLVARTVRIELSGEAIRQGG